MTVIYSSYNPYPGATQAELQRMGITTSSFSGYNFLTGQEPPLIPAVNLYNSFSFEIGAKPQLDARTSTSTTGVDPDTSYRSLGYRTGGARGSAYGASAYNAPRIFKRPTAMRWITNGGPNGDGICHNERGDWFSQDVLGRADDQGNGVYFETTPIPASTSYTYGFEDVTTSGVTGPTTSTNPLVGIATPGWNGLKIRGSYNGAVFCYNTFEYTNDNVGTIYSARSLFEIPARIDNLVTFIPDQRSSTTLTFHVEVDWVREIYWGLFGSYLSTSEQNSMLSAYDSNGVGPSGTDIHTFTHVVNNNNPNWGRVLNDIIRDRQRTIAEQDARYGNSFPTLDLSVT